MHREEVGEAVEVRSSMEDPHEITQLLVRVRRGERDALDQVFSLTYEELRRIARGRLAKFPRAPEDTGSLVHEAYVKLVGQTEPAWNDRSHFFAIAASAMRQILVDRARRRAAAKRGGGAVHVQLHEADAPEGTRIVEILEIDSVLKRLAKSSERLARVVELRYFAGLTVEEIAEMEGLDPRTVKRDWRKARAFLYLELYGEDETAEPKARPPKD